TVMAVLVIGSVIFLLLPRGRVEPDFTTEGQYENLESTLKVGSASLLGERWAFFRISLPEESDSLILEPSEWKTLTGLLSLAEQSQSQSWRVVGAISETVPGDRSRLEISSGV